MKQKSKFDESRPEMFRLLYAEAYGEIRSQLWKVGKKIGSIGGWGGAGVRKRARQLARESARLRMKQFRAEVHP